MKTSETYLREALGNETYNDLLARNTQKYEALSAELDNSFLQNAHEITQKTNMIMKGIVTDLSEVSESLGITLQKSEELSTEWKLLCSKLDAFLKMLNKYKKYIGYSAATLLIITFIFKMGIARKIPAFIGDLVSYISLPAIIIILHLQLHLHQKYLIWFKIK